MTAGLLYMSATILSACLLSAPALADNSCDTATFPATPARLLRIARVKPGAHANFLTGREGCPADTAACRQSAYVVAGDTLLTGVSHGPYTCAYYTNRRSETAGWLPTDQLQSHPVANLSRAAWRGTWHYAENTLVVTSAGAALAVTAQAYWPSKSDPNGHEGHLAAQARPVADSLSLVDPDDPQGCKLGLTLAVPYMVAHDNNACGGANVSFSGVYVR